MARLTHHLLSESAARRPEAEAVRFEGRALTYGGLEALSNQVAHVLRERGVRRGDRVGIYLKSGIEAVAAAYGSMKAGAAYVPLDPYAPPARLLRIVADCDVRGLVTAESMGSTARALVAGAPGLAAVLGLAPEDGAVGWDDVRAAPSEAPRGDEPGEEEPAYVLYTSGSTGDPKGILHTHRSALAFVAWAAREFGLHEGDRVGNPAPLHFDLSTFGLFATALGGATTVMISEAASKLPAELSRLIEREGVTVWYSVPFALTQILTRGALDRRDLSRLRWVLFAGEPFPTKHLRDLMNRLPGARFANLYGPTETNVCTCYHVPPLPDGTDEPIPIGRPCAGDELLVVDADGRAGVPGEPGELLVRGPTLMRGYWGRPDLDARVFAQPADETDVFYRTGDMVQELPGGDYRFLGRKDRQVKTRGYRVELDEIEAALLAHERVQEAAVYARTDRDESSRIEAAVVARDGAALDPTELAAHLGARLPPYAIPVEILVADDFPRTSTGKIDRRELLSRSRGEGR